ncbi:MAG: flagellin lysine-N-methylase [Selenomonadaceae bacterium]|nr:flagellin lysine-N-methylase [Selenomonadaceae bacterium]
MLLYLRPTYLEKFKCDGAACQSNCCQGWQVVFDAATVAKYRELADDVGAEIMTHLEPPAEDGSATLRLKADGRCPFLLSTGLCRLQKEWGEEFLADICFSYPRITYLIGNVLWQALTVTCPVAAELILWPDKPLALEEKEVAPKRLGWAVDLTEQLAPWGDSWRGVIERYAALLGWREHPLDARLAMLLNMAAELDEVTAATALADREAKTEEWLAKMRDFAPPTFTPVEPDQDRGYVEIMAELYSTIYDRAEWRERIPELLFAYRAGKERYNREVWGSYAHIIENYLVNELWLRLYPFAFNGSFLHNIKIFITGWKVMEFGLRLTAITRPEDSPMNRKDTTALIGKLASSLDHNKKGMGTIRRYAEEHWVGMSAADFAALMLGLGV